MTERNSSASQRPTPGRRFLSGRDGSTAIEYALIAGLIAIAIVAGVTAVGTKLASNYYDTFAAYLTN